MSYFERDLSGIQNPQRLKRKYSSSHFDSESSPVKRPYAGPQSPGPSNPVPHPSTFCKPVEKSSPIGFDHRPLLPPFSSNPGRLTPTAFSNSGHFYSIACDFPPFCKLGHNPSGAPSFGSYRSSATVGSSFSKPNHLFFGPPSFGKPAHSASGSPPLSKADHDLPGASFGNRSLAPTSTTPTKPIRLFLSPPSFRRPNHPAPVSKPCLVTLDQSIVAESALTTSSSSKPSSPPISPTHPSRSGPHHFVSSPSLDSSDLSKPGPKASAPKASSDSDIQLRPACIPVVKLDEGDKGINLSFQVQLDDSSGQSSETLPQIASRGDRKYYFTVVVSEDDKPHIR